MYATMSIVLIEMQSSYWDFWLSRKVSVSLLGTYIILNTFLADKRHTNDNKFHKFCRQLFHTSIAHILSNVRTAMSTPEVARTPDGHFCRVIYSIGPYIADYPEQVLLACTVQGWCPW